MKEDLSRYRLGESKQKLESSRILLENGMYKDSISRSYYAMFSAARALLATRGLDSKKHSGVISLFNQYLVKTGIVKKETGKLLGGARGQREISDYADFAVFSKEEAEQQYDNAKRFVQEIDSILEDLWAKEHNDSNSQGGSL